MLANNIWDSGALFLLALLIYVLWEGVTWVQKRVSIQTKVKMTRTPKWSTSSYEEKSSQN